MSESGAATTTTARVTPRGRPRVVILGGGFAGVGAAKKLAGAEAEVVLVDRHDYHTSSRSCTSSPRACSRPRQWGTRSATSSRIRTTRRSTRLP